MKKLRPIMFAGTGSDVGKSIIAAAFCRIFKQDGFNPAPFKAQNMALNSFATKEGLEMGRAQAVQAEAAGIPPEVDMNPILLKPNSNHTSQVVLLGKAIGNKNAYQYFRREGRDILREEVWKAYDRLNNKYNPIVLEGAGSIAEINLKKNDLVNMSMAIKAGADVILVADIDRGGVFASIYGSIMLQDEEERKHIKGVIINKFRGDLRLFEEGKTMIENLCKVPVLGIIPYMEDLHIEDEDSVAVERKNMVPTMGKVNIAVVKLCRMSNFTDFNALELDNRVNLFYTDDYIEISKADIVILPGSKTTIHDLKDIQRKGIDKAIRTARERGATILGICGGYQMMGQEIIDQELIESEETYIPGLALLPTSTIMEKEKITQQVEFSMNEFPEISMQGYEIHCGRTKIISNEGRSLNITKDNKEDGCIVDERCMGTYIHGVLDNKHFVDFLIKPHLNSIGKDVQSSFDYKKYKEEQYNKLADHVREYVDIEEIYKLLS